MTLTLLSHQWKAFWRSRNAGKSLAVQLFLGFLLLYLLACTLVLGLAIRHFLTRAFPGQDIVPVFGGLILYYFFFDWLLRFLLQELPVLSVQPYLAQPIRRSQLVLFLNVRSLFHFLNLMPVLLFVPFAVTAIAATHGPLAVTAFIASILLLTAFNHFLILYIKRKTIINGWWLAGFLVVVCILALLDKVHVFSIRQVSSLAFIRLLTSPWLCIVPLALAIIAFVNNQRFLLANLYLEEISQASRQRQSRDYAWLQQLGLTGSLIALDIKLILRNKRPRFILIVSLLILFYGFIFYKPEYLSHDSGYPMVLLGAFMITGIFMINYGQCLFAWQSSHFDGLLSSGIDVAVYIRSKLMLFIAVSTATFIITSLYGLISWKVVIIQAATYLYNIGITSIITIYFATYSYKAIDLSRGATFNFQGTGAAQWLYAIVVFLVPLGIFILLAKISGPWTGFAVIGGLGLISLLLQNWWIGLLTREFSKRKHLILQGFREK